MIINDIDKFGNCVLCHRNLVKNVVVNNKLQGVFDADKDQIFVKFNNGSCGHIAICKPCKSNTDVSADENRAAIMEQVHIGWTLEMNHMDENADKFQGWNSDKRKLMQDYYNTITDYTLLEG